LNGRYSLGLNIFQAWKYEITRRKLGKYFKTFAYAIIFGYDPKSLGNKSKIENMGLHQTKKILHNKDKINRVKKQPIEWEKKSLPIIHLTED
jgi:hypothetical protein